MQASIPRFYPWQLSAAKQWLQQRQRFAHAWLVHGMAGIGKQQFATAGACSLLCEAPQQGLACGSCTSCHWMALGNHPDYRFIRPNALEEAAEGGKGASREIRIEQVRQLHDWFNMATHRGGYRVAVFYPATAINHVTANALLKLLEEPPEHTVFILVADAPDRLLATILSRCRRLPLAPPSTTQSIAWLAEQGLNQAEQWLAAAGGAPLRALELSQTHDTAYPSWLQSLLQAIQNQQLAQVGDLLEALEKETPPQWFDALQRLFVDLCLLAHGQQARYFPGLSQETATIAQKADPTRLAETMRWLNQQQALANHPLSVRLFIDASLQRVILACRPVQFS